MVVHPVTLGHRSVPCGGSLVESGSLVRTASLCCARSSSPPPSTPTDFSSLPADPWWPQGETRQQLEARVAAFKQALQRHPARVIVVIGHGGFLRTLLELDEGGADITIDHCQLHNHVLEWPHEPQHDEL